MEWRWVDLLLVLGLGLFVLFDIFLGSFDDDNDIIICYNGSLLTHNIVYGINPHRLTKTKAILTQINVSKRSWFYSRSAPPDSSWRSNPIPTVDLPVALPPLPLNFPRSVRNCGITIFEL